jgi:hypothetical protein
MATRPQQTSADLVDALPAYILSDSLQDVADSIIAEHDAFRILNDIRMGYAERTDVKTEDDADIDTIIGVKRAGPLWGSLGEYDVVCWVNSDWWRLMGKSAARAAAVTHALSHILVTDEGKVKLVGHDVDAFIRETVKYGPWSNRLSRLWRSMGREPKPEQTEVETPDNVAHIDQRARKPPVVDA